MRDYAKKGRHSGSQAAPRKRAPARKKGTTAKKPAGGGSARNKVLAIKFLLVGLLIGLFVALLIHLDKRRSQQPASTQTTSQSKPQTKPHKSKPKATPQEAEAPPVEYEFFQLLPNAKVTKPTVGVPRQPTTLDGKQGEVLPFGTYLLQAGAFRNPRDADARRAELALLGLISEVVPVTLPDGVTWQRIRLGPYTERQELKSVLQKLHQNNIEYISFKLKK